MIYKSLCQIPRIRGLYREIIRPKKILLCEGDKRILLLNQRFDKKIYYFDLEKGQTTNELVRCFSIVNRYVNLIEDLKNFHTDPSDPEQKDVFIGFNKKSVFIFSPQNSGDFKSIHK